MTAAIILMGGSGERFGSALPKQFHRLAGKKIYQHTLETFIRSSLFDEVILVCPKPFLSMVSEEIRTYELPSLHVICGGTTRQESSFLGLSACNPKTNLVVIHDAVRPFVSKKILEENIEAAFRFHAVDTCIPSADTIVYSKNQKEIGHIPNRSEYLRGQTPQSFSYTLIFSAHELAKKNGLTNVSDDCRLALESGHPVHIVQGSEDNIKITTELDLFLAEQILRQQKHPENIRSTESLRGKTFAVVGGTGGIGSWICTLLQKEGARALSLSRTSSPFSLDLIDPPSIARAFEKIHALYGPLDGLINAAGLLRIQSFELLSAKEIEEMLSVNLTGLLHACKAAKLKPGGHLINIASSSFTRGREGYGLYSSAKAAVVNFTQALAEERGDLRIHVVIPQRTNTPMRRSNFPEENLNDLIEPEEVAKKVLSLLQDPHLTGSMIEVRKGVLK